jgi:hypothetical protein
MACIDRTPMHQSLCSLSILSRVPTIVNVRESSPQGLVGFRGFTHGKKAIQELARGLDPSGARPPNEDSRVSGVGGGSWGRSGPIGASFVTKEQFLRHSASVPKSLGDNRSRPNLRLFCGWLSLPRPRIGCNPWVVSRLGGLTTQRSFTPGVTHD